MGQSLTERVTSFAKDNAGALALGALLVAEAIVEIRGYAARMRYERHYENTVIAETQDQYDPHTAYREC